MADPISSTAADNAIRTALNGLAARQRVVANNLANVDTPGFKASDLRFEDQLQSALAQKQSNGSFMLVSTNPRFIVPDSDGLGGVQPQVVRQNNSAERADGNNVDIDQEMVKLAETSLSYNALVQLAAARISLAKYAVTEGGR